MAPETCASGRAWPAKTLLLFGLAITCWCTIPVAYSHETSVASLHLDLDQAPFAGDFSVALEDLATVVTLDQNSDGAITRREFDSAASRLTALVAPNVAVSTTSGKCETSVNQLQLRSKHGQASVEFELTFHCAQRSEPVLHYQLFADVDPTHRLSLLFTSDKSSFSRWIVPAVEPAAPTNALLKPSVQGDSADLSRDAEALPRAGEPAVWAPFFSSGVEHVLLGFDHLLFLVVLLLPALLIGTRGRRDASLAAFKSRAISVAGVVTAFTAAHSLTLAVAALDWWRPPAAAIELLIALSIAFAAGNNLVAHRASVEPHAAAVAAGFGLLHGFGFSNVLGPLGLPVGHELAALAAFNLGVETGQMIFVAGSAGVLMLASALVPRDRLLVGGSALALAVAAVWSLERATYFV